MKIVIAAALIVAGIAQAQAADPKTIDPRAAEKYEPGAKAAAQAGGIDLSPVVSLVGAMDKAEYSRVANAAPLIANPCGADAPKAIEFIGSVAFASQPQAKDVGMILLTCRDGSRKGMRLAR